MAMDGPQKFEITGGVESLGVMMGSKGPIGTIVPEVDPVKNAQDVQISRSSDFGMGGLG